LLFSFSKSISRVMFKLVVIDYSKLGIAITCTHSLSVASKLISNTVAHFLVFIITTFL